MSFEVAPVYRLRQQVEEQIRRAIVTKQISEGDKLPSEAELAARFTVSRSTVREALRSLVNAGLIEKIPGASGGSFVKKLDENSLGNLIGKSMGLFVELGNASADEVGAVREFLERPASRLAAQHRTDADVARLYEIVEAQKRSTVEDPSVPVLDINFHSAVAQAAGNRVLSSFVMALHSVTQPVRQIRLSPEAGRRTVRQHLDVVKAIEARDPDAAEAAIIDHLSYLRKIKREPARSPKA
jgi:GntR family transcriptional regulator, transcriptional repressor for pyruvate dehydrogenase complex